MNTNIEELKKLIDKHFEDLNNLTSESHKQQEGGQRELMSLGTGVMPSDTGASRYGFFGLSGQIKTINASNNQLMSESKPKTDFNQQKLDNLVARVNKDTKILKKNRSFPMFPTFKDVRAERAERAAKAAADAVDMNTNGNANDNANGDGDGNANGKTNWGYTGYAAAAAAALLGRTKLTQKPLESRYDEQVIKANEQVIADEQVIKANEQVIKTDLPIIEELDENQIDELKKTIRKDKDEEPTIVLPVINKENEKEDIIDTELKKNEITNFVKPVINKTNIEQLKDLIDSHFTNLNAIN
jgi:hypothetical protein